MAPLLGMSRMSIGLQVVTKNNFLNRIKTRVMKDHPNLMTSETELFNVPKALQNPIKKGCVYQVFCTVFGCLTSHEDLLDFDSFWLGWSH